MNKKLKIALKNSSSEQGFAIPIAIGMGLIMILIASTMIVRSQGDEVTASTQKATNRGLSAAETGVTRYQSLINNNRAIAKYPRVGTPSWTTAVNIPGIGNCSGSTTTGSTAVTNTATTIWRSVDSTDPSKGQYRLVEYTYSPTAGAVPGTGTLTVAGRVNQVDANSDGDDTDDDDTSASTATTKLVVDIPVNAGSLNTVVPGLWVKNSTITKMGRDKINGNIVINSCPPVTSATSANLYDPDTQKVIANPVGFPDTPALPPPRLDSSPSYYTLAGSPFGTTFPRPLIPAVSGKKATPAVPADEPAADGYYHYLVNDLVASGGGEITITPGKKVIFYVQGNIDLGGNPDINKTAGNTADQMQIYGNTYTSASTTKYGCTGLRLGSSCPTLTASFNGSGTMRAFLHAPDATGSVNGGGNTEGNFKGSIWIKDWDASSNNSKVKIDAEGNYSNLLGAQNIITPPVIFPANSWQRQGV